MEAHRFSTWMTLETLKYFFYLIPTFYIFIYSYITFRSIFYIFEQFYKHANNVTINNKEGHIILVVEDVVDIAKSNSVVYFYRHMTTSLMIPAV